MQIKSDSKATEITNYSHINDPCYLDNKLYMSIRSYEHNGISYYDLVDPRTLDRITVPQGNVDSRKKTGIPDVFDYSLREDIDKTPYRIALNTIKSSPESLTESGLKRSMRPQQSLESNEVFLSVDMCPSMRFFEMFFFEKLVEMGRQRGSPVPIAICFTAKWMRNHINELNWLFSQEDLAITAVNHGATHLFYADCVSTEDLLSENFLGDPFTNWEYEIFEPERVMKVYGITPSVFFRAPGLVTPPGFIEYLCKLGLILINTDAWLAKMLEGQEPKSGDIILVHGNSNEKPGIEKMMSYLEKNKFTFSPLSKICLDYDQVTDYLTENSSRKLPRKSASSCHQVTCCSRFFSNTRCVIQGTEGYETDEDAVKALDLETEECITEKKLSWSKPGGAKAGTRVIPGDRFSNPGQRLQLFRDLSSKKYAVSQHQGNDNTVYLQVSLPTINKV